MIPVWFVLEGDNLYLLPVHCRTGSLNLDIDSWTATGGEIKSVSIIESAAKLGAFRSCSKIGFGIAFKEHQR